MVIHCMNERHLTGTGNKHCEVSSDKIEENTWFPGPSVAYICRVSENQTW
jgi:hypothetical protein